MIMILADRYIFDITHNISDFKKSIKPKINSQDTLNRVVYSNLGLYEEELSFNARILFSLKNELLFKGLEDLIKQGKPLKFTALDFVWFKYILINDYEIEASDWVKTHFKQSWYYTKKISIKGYILEGNGDEKISS